MNPSEIKIFYTTADIGISVRGKTISELFQNAAKGISALLVKEVKEFEQDDKIEELKISAQSYESLLVKFLNELLYFYETDFLFFRKAEFFRLNENELKGQIHFKRLKEKAFIPNYEIKAVTYHNLKIIKKRVYYYADIIFDI